MAFQEWKTLPLLMKRMLRNAFCIAQIEKFGRTFGLNCSPCKGLCSVCLPAPFFNSGEEHVANSKYNDIIYDLLDISISSTPYGQYFNLFEFRIALSMTILYFAFINIFLYWIFIADFISCWPSFVSETNLQLGAIKKKQD